jgi:uncharacterized YccA/Bax inhibitor family protein
MDTKVDQTNDNDEDERSSGLMYAVFGVALLVLGSLLLAAVPVSDNEALIGAGGLALLGCALYLIVAGAVARGIQLARQSSHERTSSESGTPDRLG